MPTPEDGGPLPELRATPEARERVLDTLSRHFAAGRIELEDLERRMETAARAATMTQLESALAGLTPARQAAVVPAAGALAVVPRAARARRTLAFLGGHRRVGRWSPPRLQKAAAVFGGIHLDYRDAVFQEGDSEIELFVMFGGAQLIVPPDLDVEVEGSAILGGINNGAMEPEGQRPGRRLLRVHARVIMGGVDVKVMDREAAAASPPGTPPPPGTP